ncbi:MAG: NTP transferase domain-containing protein [Deltaproteobacteria bacterium]|nr:NTP transferase domain-containing protein [Deltaproteobacteria bacterium]
MDERLSGAVLAAGHGQRLRDATGGIPKPLVDIGGRPLLLRQIEILGQIGVSPIHVIINSETYNLMLGRELRLPGDVELLIGDTANSMESLLRLGERIAPGRFLMMTVDAVLFAADIGRFVAKATKLIAKPGSRLDGALGVVQWRGDAGPLFVHIGADRVIDRFGEPRTRTVTAGVYLLSTGVFTHATEARSRGLNAMRRFLAMLVDRGFRFAAVEITRAIDVDTAADLTEAREMIVRGPE